MEDSNPRVARPLLILTWIEVVVVGGAAGLYTLPWLVVPFWPWTLTPFNAMLVGATYFAAWIPLVIFAWVGRWNPGRVVLPMIGVFTTYILIISIIGVNTLLWNRFGTYIWTALYVILPISSAYYLWQYWNWQPVAARPTPAVWRVILLVLAVAYTLYGLGMLIAPEPMTGWWPWPIDAFNGRMYGANFLTLAAGFVVLNKVTSRLEFFTVGVTALTLGLVAIFGMFIVDISARRIGWTEFETFAWIGMFGFYGLVGLGMMITAAMLPPATAATVSSD